MPEQSNVAALATAADVMRPPLTTVEQQGHVAAAAYLMKHAGTTALMVLSPQTGQPVGIITEADVAVTGGRPLGRRAGRIRARLGRRPRQRGSAPGRAGVRPVIGPACVRGRRLGS